MLLLVSLIKLKVLFMIFVYFGFTETHLYFLSYFCFKKLRSMSSKFGWEQNKNYFCISRCFLFYLKMFRAWILMVCFCKIDIFYWFFSLRTNNSLLPLKGKYRMLSNILMDIDFSQLEVRTTVKSIYYLVEFDRKQINWMRLNLNFSCFFSNSKFKKLTIGR